MQFGRGLEVELGHEEPDDVVFFSNDKGQITTSESTDGRGRVIHASGEVRIDVLKGDALHRHEDDVKSHHVAGIRRWTRAPQLKNVCLVRAMSRNNGTPVSLFAVSLPQRFQHVDDFLNAPFIGPSQESFGVIDAFLHGQINGLRGSDLPKNRVCRLVHQHGQNAF